MQQLVSTALIAITGFAVGATAVYMSQASQRPVEDVFDEEAPRERNSSPEDSGKVQERLLEAIDFSAYKHRNQRRKNPKQTPYINHPISVATRLVKSGVHDTDVLISAILHDTVEDTDTTIAEIRDTFGPAISSIVSQCTDNKSLPKQERKRLQIEHAPYCTHEAKLVKLADKLDNLTGLLSDIPIGWQPERVSEYFGWAEKVVNGLRNTNAPLEAQLDSVLSKRQIAINIAANTNADSNST